MNIKLKSNRENRVLLIMLFVFSISMLFFFTSKVWMYDDDPIKQTPFGQEIFQHDQTEVVLKKWEYNEQDNFMEVVIEKKHKGSDIIKPTFQYVAKDALKDSVLDSKIVFESNEIVVLEIMNLPEKFKYITVAMDEYRDEETLRIEYRESTGSEEFTLPKPKRVVFVGDYREVEINNQLVTRDSKEYEKENILVEIEQLQNEITFIENDKRPHISKGIIELEDEIVRLTDEIKFATETEKKDLESEIESKKGSIKRALKNKKELDEEVVTLENKIEKLELKYDYLDGKDVEFDEEEEKEED